MIEVRNVSLLDTMKHLKLYNTISKKLILSRDVKFLENQLWIESENQQMENQNPLLPISENIENSRQPIPQPALPRLQVEG